MACLQALLALGVKRTIQMPGTAVLTMPGAALTHSCAPHSRREPLEDVAGMVLNYKTASTSRACRRCNIDGNGEMLCFSHRTHPFDVPAGYSFHFTMSCGFNIAESANLFLEVMGWTFEKLWNVSGCVHCPLCRRRVLGWH